MKNLTVSHEGIDVIFFEQDNILRLYGIFPDDISKELQKSVPEFSKLTSFVETELHCSGENQADHHGFKTTGGNPGKRLVFNGFTESVENGHRKLIISYYDKPLGLNIESNYLFVKGIPVIRRWVTVKNVGNENVGLEHLYSAVINGIGLSGTKKWDERMRLHIPYSSWYCEGQWKNGRLHEFGFHRTRDNWLGLTCISIWQTGSFSTNNYLPMGILQDEETETVWFWQIEHNGSWNWELGEMPWDGQYWGLLYLYIGGPNEIKNHWWKNLKPGESFTTVPVSIGVTKGGFDDAVKYLTQYRRKICLMNHSDNKKLSVIFNDYMNCLWGNPTTEKEIPLIEAASKAGCEYFVIDAGWFAKLDDTWSGLNSGLWEESPDRFPNGGLKKLFDIIREKGMIPGLWLEIEVIGMNCPLKTKPDSWFMMRHGKRVIDSGRYFLDFRNPEVREHATNVIDRLIRDYGIGYIKNDYNETAKMGTETNADSFGDGLLQHNRAFLDWIDSIHKKYPDLVIENCGSGGLRMDYATLSHFQLQSSSDQTDYFSYPSILSGSMANCLPEQLAVWCYPLSTGDEEETIFNMVNCMLSRIHLSGHLATISDSQFEYVKKGIALYKTYREEIPNMYPFYPTGTITISDRDKWHSFALIHEKKRFALLSVWRLRSNNKKFAIPLQFIKSNKKPTITQFFPDDRKCKFKYSSRTKTLEVEFNKQLTARLFKINF